MKNTSYLQNFIKIKEGKLYIYIKFKIEGHFSQEITS